MKLGLGLNIFNNTFNNITPFSNDALFWLDGTISGNEFVDRTGNGRNFTITGKDFDSNWTKGFPYKSVATISAPVADAILIAADVNNFLYDVGETPNEIPVVSFFQDIDYEHKLFCRHLSQRLDENSTEATEPRILDIVLYNTIKSGNDLTVCQNYYEVPTEDLTALKVGSGKTYTTIDAAIIAASPNNNIYVYGNVIFEENNAIRNSLRINKNVNIVSLGRNTITANVAGDRVIWFENSTVSIEGFIVDGQALHRCSYFDGGSSTIERCKLFNASTGAANYTIDGNNGIGFVNNSVVIGTVGAGWTIRNRGANLDVDTSYIDGKGLYTFYTLNGSGTTQWNYKHNKILTDCTTYDFYLRSSGLYEIFDNNIIFNSGTTNSIAFELGGFTGDFNMKRNICNFDSNYSSAIKLITDSTFDIDISDNKFNYSTQLDNGVSIEILDQSNPIVSNNTFTSALSTRFNYIWIHNTVNSDFGNAELNYNSFFIKNKDGHCIYFGHENRPTFENTITADIIGNRVFGARYYNPSEADVVIHALFAGYVKNVNFKYNYVNGSGIAIIAKGTTTNLYTDGGIFYNVLIDDYQNIRVKGVSGIKAYGNSIYNSLAFLIYGLYVTNNLGADPGGIDFKNNIIYFNDDSTVRELINVLDDNYISDYNIIKSESSNDIIVVDAVTKTFAEYQGLGFDVNSQNIDPLYDNLTKLTLEDDSPAIGNGTDLGTTYKTGLGSSTNWGDENIISSVVTKDQTVPWDIGAYIN